MKRLKESKAANSTQVRAGSAPHESAQAAARQLASPMRGALVSLSLTMLLSSLGSSIANVGLPTLVQAFGVSFQQVQWVVLAYLLAITSLIVSVGRLGDLMGRRRLLLGGVLLFAFASLLCGLAEALWQLVAARVLQGLGAAVMMALSMAFVSEAVPKAKVGSAMGLLGSMSAVGTAMGPTLGGFLIAYSGWQAMFLVNLPLGLLVGWWVWRTLPADRVTAQVVRARIDLAGTGVMAVMLTSYAFAMTTGQGHFGGANLALLVLAGLGLGLFVRVENRVASPLVRPALLRDSQLSTGFAVSALVTTVVMATLVVGPFYLSGAMGLDAAQVGLVMSSGPMVAALTGLPAGRVVDRFGTPVVALVGLLAMVTGCLALALLPRGPGLAGYMLGLMVTTAGYAVFQAANNTAVMGHAGAEQRGVVSGLLNLSRNLGLITGASVMGAVFAWGTSHAGPRVSPAQAVATGMHWTFAAAAALVFIAMVVSGLQSFRSRRPVGATC